MSAVGTRALAAVTTAFGATGASSTCQSAILALPPPECKVYTPAVLAAAMARAIVPEPNDLWLDPCMGPGAFLSALHDCGVPKTQIVGLDLDPSPGHADGFGLTQRGLDFFDWCHATPHRFTKIVANPPYVALSKLDVELQRRVQHHRQPHDPSFALRGNYWCAFLAASLDLLQRHGSLAFVLPAAWDYALYAQALRDRVTSSFRSVEVHRSQEPLFPDVREGRVVLVARGYLERSERLNRIDHPTASSLIGALNPTQCCVAAPADNGFHVEPTSTSLGDLFSIGIGVVTGDVRYFLLTEAERAEWNLPLSALRPVVSRARHLTKAAISKRLWNRLRDAGERVWLFAPDTRAEKNRAVRAYLRHGETVCNLDGYKLRHRDPWYRLPESQPGTGFMSGMSGTGPWVARRAMRDLLASNTLYVVTSHHRMTLDEQAAWFLSLLSSHTREQAAARARRYPDGLAKFEPRDICGLHLLKPKRIEGACERYDHAISLLLSGDRPGASAFADQWVVNTEKEMST